MRLLNEMGEFVEPDPAPRLLKLKPVDMEALRRDESRASQGSHERTCRGCGREFRSRSNAKLYCSDACRRKAELERKRARIREWLEAKEGA